ncbi:hypothetical protein CALCODRAFT_160688 [Calocera cornea HHB12733]|uniref:Uncharacterized protein n=1 Tax=Calocera cornea HHB12733 TaxID=1353952 RepID=A0A165CKQ3_9BASI|nr:hypothetical protein CALCODRAFT_160688 [Calocera cornea HHB12733]
MSPEDRLAWKALERERAREEWRKLTAAGKAKHIMVFISLAGCVVSLVGSRIVLGDDAPAWALLLFASSAFEVIGFGFLSLLAVSTRSRTDPDCKRPLLNGAMSVFVLLAAYPWLACAMIGC